MNEIIEKIRKNRMAIYIILASTIVFALLTLVLTIIQINKNKQEKQLIDEIVILRNEKANRLKNSKEYSEFEQIVLAFAREKYYQIYNYYSTDYFASDEKEDINGKMYWKIHRIDELKTIFTDKKFEEFIKTEKIIKQGEDYYIPIMSKEENELYIKELSGEMAIKEIDNERIEIVVEEAYYNDDEIFDTNNTKTQLNIFVLVKENDIWRIDEFTYPNKKY